MALRLSLLATALVFAAMWAWSIPAINALSGGALLFDARLTGYGVDEARALLVALGEKGRALYLGRQQALDTAFPALLALSLILAARRFARPAPGRVVMALAVIYAGFDYSENAAVARMLMAGPDALTPEMAQLASRLTIAKYAALALAMALLGVAAWRRRGDLPAR